jgi:proteasome activator subunit 4
LKWHVPSRAEIEFAVKLFCSQAGGAVEALESLTSETSAIKRDGTGKEWSDEVTRNLVLLRLSMSGVAGLFDPEYVSEGTLAGHIQGIDDDVEMKDENGIDIDAEVEEEVQDDEPKTTHKYPAGYAFKDKSDPLYIAIHELRDRIGNTLHRVHKFLSSKQEDDVACFNALYSV